MAISRAQLLKELLPGLNALLVSNMLATAKSTRKSSKRRPPSVRSKKKPSSRASRLRR